MDAHSSITILLIDFSDDDTEAINKFLREEQFNLFDSHQLEDALHKIENIFPDIILLNGTNLGKKPDGIIAKVRKSTGKTTKKIPLIYLVPLNANSSQFVNHEELGCDEVFGYFRHVPNSKHYSEVPINPDLCLSVTNSHLRTLLQGHIIQRNQKIALDEISRQLSRMQRVIERELNETAKMQRSFLPSDFPRHPELELSALYHPSIKVGGDYYDVIRVDEYHWGLVIADIAGHGTAAAVVMAMTQMVVKEYGRGITSPQEALFLFNRKLNDNLSSDHYVTMFYAVLDLRTMQLVYAHAGHVPLMYYQARENQILEMKTEPSFPLRTFEMKRYEEKSIELNPGDVVLFFTDGVTDIQNYNNDFFGMERLEKIVLEKSKKTPHTLLSTIFKATEKFREPRERQDDFTLMALKRRVKRKDRTP